MEMLIRLLIITSILFSISCKKSKEESASEVKSIEELQQDFIDLRFGAFFHFGIRTFTGGAWGEANQDITKFNPTNLDCGQWADALVKAKMKFGILTTKHHDGFCLYDSKFTDYDVASIPWKDGKGDVVREYVDAFRVRGLEPCLYYSVWDNTAEIGNGEITEEDMKVIKGQLTEILSNYGEIKFLFVDGWSWKMGHRQVPYNEIRALVKELQPTCVLLDNTHLPRLYNNDMIHFEDGCPCPIDNKIPAILTRLIYKDSGNSWFWDERVPTAELMSVEEIVDENLKYLEPRWCDFVLNLPPNAEGLLDSNVVERLIEVGNAWNPNPGRAPLPKQAPQNEYPILPASAHSSVDTAFYAIDAKNDRYAYTVWETSKNLPDTLIIDLGKVYNDVTYFSYVPKFVPVVIAKKEGSIKKFVLSKSIDNKNYETLVEGEWNGDTSMKVETFAQTKARYLRFEVLSGVDGFGAVTEVAIGRTPIK